MVGKSSQVATTWQKVGGIALAATTAVCLVTLAFIWPAVTSEVKNIPIAIAGDSTQTEIVTKMLNSSQSNLFTVTPAVTRDEAVTFMEQRNAYGAIILGPSLEILTASANGPVVSQILGQVGQQLQVPRTQAAQQAGQSVPPLVVTDIVPLSKNDERGTVLAAMGFPLAMGGMLGGVLISFLVVGTLRRLVAALLYASIGGLAVVAILHGWLGVLPGDYLANSAVVGLALLGTSILIVGLHSLIGQPGIGIGALLTLLIGNPISSTTQPMQFLLEPWGTVGQWFVPGAAGTLLRNVAYFPEASIAFPLYVLLGWVTLGAFFISVGHLRSTSSVKADSGSRKKL